MSAIASFILLPKSKLDDLQQAATRPDDWHEWLDENGRPAADYEYSGYLLATLLPYLEARHNIDLMDSDYNELGNFLSKEREATYFVFTEKHKMAYADQLSPEFFSAALLCEYFNKFNAASETEIGEPMLDGIRAIQESLKKVDGDSVIIFSIE